MKLLFIHGRSQQGKDPVQLRQQWEDTWQKGLNTAGLQRPQSIQVVFPFYGDQLDELLKELDAPTVEDVMYKGAAPDSVEASFRGEMLYEIAKEAGISDAEIQSHYAGLPQEKGPLNWGWVQAILKALDKTPLGETALDAFTRDVYVYLTNKAVRKRINAIVADCFSDGSCVVVAHSLGTVVGYNVLSQLPKTIQVKKYITVGSPLGLNAIKQNLVSPLKMPPCVDSWFNAFDDRDVVALLPLDSNTFNINPAIENKMNVDNQTDNRHGIIGYLNDVTVATKIYEALSTGS